MAELSSLLVIHGIANRNSDAFTRTVEGVARALGRSLDEGVFPVYWGGLAHQAESGLQSVPRDDDALPLPGGALAFASPDPASLTQALLENLGALGDPTVQAEALAAATIRAVRTRTGSDVPEQTQDVIRQVLQGAASRGQRLALQADLADALAEAVVLSPQVGSGFVEVQALEHLNKGLDTILQAFNREAGRLVGGTLQGVLRGVESALSPQIALTVGDILTYEKQGDRIRGVLDEAYAKAREWSDQVDLIAHSLGGVVATEWLLGAKAERADHGKETPSAERTVRTLVTFGTQVALFAELHGLLGSAGLSPRTVPSVLTIRVERWLNVWHQIDPLAFVIRRVLLLQGDEGAPPREVVDYRLELDEPPTDLGDLNTHTRYWTDPRFLAWLKSELEAE